jgi:hypothetical protein
VNYIIMFVYLLEKILLGGEEREKGKTRREGEREEGEGEGEGEEYPLCF